jgi:hypothetical protein
VTLRVETASDRIVDERSTYIRGGSSSGSTSCTAVNDASDVDRLLTAPAELADG